MSDPDLEGFVRMEGVKGKRYLAVKRDVMAYYNTYNVRTRPRGYLLMCSVWCTCVADDWVPWVNVGILRGHGPYVNFPATLNENKFCTKIFGVQGAIPSRTGSKHHVHQVLRPHSAVKPQSHFCRATHQFYLLLQDFKAGTPIHIVEMKVASVRAVAKNKLDLTTPYASYG